MENEEKEKRCGCAVKTVRAEEVKRELTVRLNRVLGQLNGVKNLVENDAYCMDIIVQVMAATAALKSFTAELLSAHISSCVVDDVKHEKYEKVDELLRFLKKLMN